MIMRIYLRWGHRRLMLWASLTSLVAVAVGEAVMPGSEPVFGFALMMLAFNSLLFYATFVSFTLIPLLSLIDGKLLLRVGVRKFSYSVADDGAITITGRSLTLAAPGKRTNKLSLSFLDPADVNRLRKMLGKQTE